MFHLNIMQLQVSFLKSFLFSLQREKYQRLLSMPKASSSIMSGLNRLKSSPSTPRMTPPPSMMMPSPFHFPFSPFSLGMGLMGNDQNAAIDPNRILHLLHQQSLLAEELLKYRSLLGMPSTSTSNPYLDTKPSIELFKISSDNQTKTRFDRESVHDSEMIPSKKQTPSSTSEIDLTKDDSRSTPKIKARPESELLPEKTSTSISAAAVSAMLIDPEELKCHICMANFPSLWLLEQHTALQHSQLSCTEKPYKCEHCGQNYR